GLADEFGHSDFHGIRNAEAGPLLCRLLYGFDDRSIRESKDCRTPTAYVIDVIVAIDVVNMRALGTLREKRLPAYASKRTHRGIDSTRYEAERFSKKFVRLGPRYCHLRTDSSVSRKYPGMIRVRSE